TAPPAKSSVDWRWPTEGQVLSRFANGDPTRQGVDIAGRSGQAVRAAGDGVVVYSGSGLVGYGELVIVKHDEQWLSAYGHNRSRQVNEGAKVKAGQQIAEMGSTGPARDMLHFEIRYDGKPVDPLQYLPRRCGGPNPRIPVGAASAATVAFDRAACPDVLVAFRIAAEAAPTRACALVARPPQAPRMNPATTRRPSLASTL